MIYIQYLLNEILTHQVTYINHIMLHNYMSQKDKIKVLVIGGAGYIGGTVTDALIKKNISFIVYDNLTYEPHYLKAVDFILGDIRDHEKLGKLLPQFTHVIHLAAIVGEGACNVNPALTKEINQESVKWLSENYNGKIIFTSTCSVYGNQEISSEGIAIDETRLPAPLSLYGETKVAAEKYLVGKNALIFRLGTLFGVGDQFSRLRLDLAANQMPIAAKTKGELAVYGGGIQWRPFIHVKDVGEIIANAVEKDITGIYNIGAINLTIGGLAKIVSDISGCKINHIGEIPSDKRNYNISTKRAKDAGLLLDNYRSLENNTRELIQLIHTGKLKNPNANLYLNEKCLKDISI